MNAQCHLYFKALQKVLFYLFFYSGVRDVLTGYPSCWLRYDLLRCNRRVFSLTLGRLTKYTGRRIPVFISGAVIHYAVIIKIDRQIDR